MKLSTARVKKIKSDVKLLTSIDPAITNIELAKNVGLHRNTVGKYRDEIVEETEQKRKIKRAMVLNELQSKAQIIKQELMELYSEGFKSKDVLYKNPQKLAKVVEMKWDLEKEIAKLKILLT
jgi:predicted regulator of amino acid metabolism with ACT domain